MSSVKGKTVGDAIKHVFQNQCLFDSVENFTSQFHNHVTFINNTASSGSDLFGGKVDETPSNVVIVKVQSESGYIFQDSVKVLKNLMVGEVINKTASFDNNSLSSISSIPYQVCSCDTNGQPDCNDPPIPLSMSVFPGKDIHLSLAVVGQRNGTIPSAIIAQYGSNNGASFGEFQNVTKTGTECTDHHYTVFSFENYETIRIVTSGICGEFGIPLFINMTILDCPLGFTRPSNSNMCICSEELQKYTDKCYINNQTIKRTLSDDF